MVETKNIIAIVVIAIIILGLSGFIIGTYTTSTVLYAPYTRPPLPNGFQPAGPASKLPADYIEARNKQLSQ